MTPEPKPSTAAHGAAGDPLARLGYFMEWGGRPWESLARRALDHVMRDTGFRGLDVLDLGTRHGRMAVLFALLGARVTGVDVKAEPLQVARHEALQWGVPQVRFVRYGGKLDIFRDESFDLVFAKSTLGIVPDLEQALPAIAAKLKPGGRVIFIENGRGNILVRAMRRLRHRGWDHRRWRYFTQREADLVAREFELELVVRRALPPVWLFVGRKRERPRP